MSNAILASPRVKTPVDDLILEEDVLALLAIEERTLRLWRRTRGLPHIKLRNKVIRYRRADLNRWLNQHRVAMGGV